jgi:hypothetical protein
MDCIDLFCLRFIAFEMVNSFAVISIRAQSRSGRVSSDDFSRIPSLVSSEHFSRTNCVSLKGRREEVVSVGV